MTLREGDLYAQVAFSAAADQGFEAGGHGVVKSGSVWMPDNKINGVDFVLPFRFSQGTWSLGTHGPVTLRIGEVINQFTARNITADLQGDYPWSEANPLLLTDVSVDLLGGKVTMQQLRMPQHDAALLRVNNISSSELISAINPKQFAMSGPFSGALPFWLDNNRWIIKDGWLTNSGPMRARLRPSTSTIPIRRTCLPSGAACVLATICRPGWSNTQHYRITAARQARNVRNNHEKAGRWVHRDCDTDADRLHAEDRSRGVERADHHQHERQN